MIYYVDVRQVQEEDSEKRGICRYGDSFHVIEERQLALTLAITFEDVPHFYPHFR